MHKCTHFNFIFNCNFIFSFPCSLLIIGIVNCKKCVCNKYALLLFCTSLSLVLRPFPLLIMPRSSVTHQGNITADHGAFTRGWRQVWVPDPHARQNYWWGWKQRELDSTHRYRWDSPYPMRRPELFIVRKDIQFYKQSESEPSKHFFFMSDQWHNAIMLIPWLHSNMQWTMNEYTTQPVFMHLLQTALCAPVPEAARSPSPHLKAVLWRSDEVLARLNKPSEARAHIRLGFQLVNCLSHRMPSRKSILQAWLDSTVLFVKAKKEKEKVDKVRLALRTAL